MREAARLFWLADTAALAPLDIPRGRRDGQAGMAIGADAHLLVEAVIDELHFACANRATGAIWKLILERVRHCL